MSSNPIRRFIRSLAFRLTLLYSALFTLSSAVLFGLLYFLLAATLERKDHQVVEARLRQCEAIYEGGGLAALQERVENVSEEVRQKKWFIRLTGQDRSDLFINVPLDWIVPVRSRQIHGGAAFGIVNTSRPIVGD